LTKLLIRLFVKDYKNTRSAAVRERYGMLAGVTGVVTNFLLFAFKITVGLVFGSIAITADAVNNLSDSGASLVTLFGFKMSGKPADAEHPYGHGRMEYISGLIVSFIILLLGFQLIQTSISKIIHPAESKFSLLTVVVLAASIAIKLWQCLFYRNVGKIIDSITLATSSADSLSDILATSSVLAGTLITRFTGFNLDGIMGAAVALFIMASGIKLVSATISPLLGSPPTKELVDYISKKVLSFDGIIGIHDLTVHSYGPAECFASLHCEVPAEQDIMLSHDIIDNIERKLLRENGIHLVIHLDPVVTDDERTTALKAKVRALITEISPKIGLHDFRVVWGVTHTNLIFDIVVPFKFELGDKALVSMISEKISEIDPSYNSVITVDRDMTS
jgi:cation diffusion facilitator family transporter